MNIYIFYEKKSKNERNYNHRDHHQSHGKPVGTATCVSAYRALAYHCLMVGRRCTPMRRGSEVVDGPGRLRPSR